jgi:plasmid maintenance system antidote protein VapI
MYFTMREIKHDHGAQLAVLASQMAGEQVLSGEADKLSLQAVFEAAVVYVSAHSKIDAATTAAQLLNQDSDYKRKVLTVGMREISRAMGGRDNAMAFFRQIDAPRTTIRFESVGGIQHDVLAVKNKIAVTAIRAQGERFREPNDKALHKSERELVDLLKSVRRTVSEAVTENRITANFGVELVNEIDASMMIDQRPANRAKLETLRDTAVAEMYSERRANVLAQYRKPSGPAVDPRPDTGNDEPSIH